MSLQLLVANIGVSIKFYTEKLGFDTDFRYEDFYAGISKEDFSIHLKEGKPSIEERRNKRNNEDLDIIFSVDGIEDLYEKLKIKSVEFSLRCKKWIMARNFILQTPTAISLLL